MAPPFLTLPQENCEGEPSSFSLYSLKDKTLHYPNLLQYPLKNCPCIGSSHGWLAFLDSKSDPFLFNPFSETLIRLPLHQTLPHNQPTPITKLVLSKNPSSNPNTFAAVALYDTFLDSKIAFCRGGDEQWTALDSEGGNKYYDVVCCEKTNTLFALGRGSWVESWDLNEAVPKRTIVIQDSCPKLDYKEFPTDLYSSQWYLALSKAGKILLIVRFIGNFVRPDDGKVVYEGDTLTDYMAEPLVCPYKTVSFRVFKVDSDKREWTGVEGFDDYALFLGGNQSLMVSSVEHRELKANSIYFTDDNWERFDEDYSYGGHDMGVFSMGDGSIHPILECECERQKIEPPPVWISAPSTQEISAPLREISAAEAYNSIVVQESRRKRRRINVVAGRLVLASATTEIS